VRGEFREVAKLLTDNGGKVYEEGGLVELKDSRLAGMFGYVPQQMFDFDPEWCAGMPSPALRNPCPTHTAVPGPCAALCPVSWAEPVGTAFHGPQASCTV
jgi:hypothetical protein